MASCSQTGATLTQAVVFSDASNKPDSSETDGKSQHGVVTVTLWYGGPVATVSRKLPHAAGLSAFHNEYNVMALR